MKRSARARRSLPGRALGGYALAAALVAFLVGFARARERRAARLERERLALRATIEQAPVGLSFISPDGVIQFRNATARRWLNRAGRLPARLRDAPGHSGLYWPDGRKISPEEWDRMMREAMERPVEIEIEARLLDESPKWFWNMLAPVHCEKDGHLMGTVGVLRDVTAERAVRALREELVAVIAHDLRSPIAAISLSLENALQHRRGGEDVVQVPAAALERSLRSTKRLGEMVGQLLDASRVELGKLPLDRSTVNLGSLLALLVDDVSPSLRGHSVVTDLPPYPVTTSIDPDRITQVITNLLDNASKYSRPGSTIRLTLREDGGAAHLSVADEGPGIPPTDLPKLFDRFFQAKRARQEKGGLGLGLYITKGIVDAHGGKLTVESAPGAGSTFHVWLPAVSSTSASSQVEHAPSL